jgi:hypothetical protein
LKLSQNEVEYGYQLVFVRDWLHNCDFLAQARLEAEKTRDVTVIYVEKNGDDTISGTLSPKPLPKLQTII